MLVLDNPGLIDLKTITTMGVNVKDGENTIGQFGTGMKYAIAVFLREGIDIKLIRGEHTYNFYTEPVTIRNKNFHECMMSGPFDSVNLNFITGLGKHWDVWMAYRELRSNCLDEKGFEKEIEGDTYKTDGTAFCIDISKEEVGGVFLQDTEKKLLAKTPTLEIYSGGSDFIYYQGIRAYTPNKRTKFTYNITQKCTLTEDRMLAYSWNIHEIITRDIQHLSDKRLIQEIITNNDDYFEKDLNFIGDCYSLGEGFQEIVSTSLPLVSSNLRTFYENKSTAKLITPKEKFKTKLLELCNSYNVTINDDGNGNIILEGVKDL